MRNRTVHSGDDGFILMQVVVTSVIMLAILFTGFNAVRNTIQITNTIATSSDFKDLVLAIQQELSNSNDCMDRLNIPVGTLLSSVDIPGGYTVPVLDIRKDPSHPIAFEEGAVIPPGLMVAAGFKVSELRIRYLGNQGWVSTAMPGPVPGTQELERFTAVLSIVATRRDVGFLGSSIMRAAVPLIFGVSRVGFPAVLHLENCSSRSVYQVPLGPPGILPLPLVRKSGIECIDRGGMPVMEPGTNYYVCQIPASAWGVCDTAGGLDVGNNNLPGWLCLHPTTGGAAGFTYVY